MINALLRQRFVRFGCVGLLGTVVNLALLGLGQEYLYAGIKDPSWRLSMSLLTAIAVATFHNYLWNRHWTWGDRKKGEIGEFFRRMGKYYLSCTFAIGVQYLLTTILAKTFHYMLANLMAIGFAAIISYLANDLWTFTRKSH